MKKIICSLIAFVMLATTAFAQETKTVVYDENAEVRNVESFNAINVSGGVSLYIVQGKSTAVAVSTNNKEDVSKIKTEVKNGVLKIGIENGSWNGWSWKNKTIKAYITVTDLQKITAAGASVVKISEPLQVNDLKIDISGASVLKGEVKGKNLRVIASGASVVTLSGTLQYASLDCSGASNIKAFDLAVENCKVDCSGASAIKVMVTKDLDAEATGASNVQYKGSPTINRVDATGASSIKKVS